MAYSIRFRAETLRTLAFGGIGAGYAAVGDPLDNPTRMLLVQNLTDASVLFSFDGLNDHFPLAAGAFIIFDVCSDRTNDGGFFVSAGTIINVKQLGVPTTGSVYVSAFYGQGD